MNKDTPAPIIPTPAAPVIIIGSNNVVNGNNSALILHFLAVIEAQNAQISALVQKIGELTSNNKKPF